MSAEDSAPVLEETRGPFEPLISSSGPPGTAAPPPPIPDAASAAETAGSRGRHAAPDMAGHDGPEDSAYAQARRLEQIKDFYLTAEAIGERNVDKHFDQLLAQQRELISEYFKQSNAAQAADSGQVQAGSQAESQASAQVGMYPDGLGGPAGTGRAAGRPEPTHSATVSGEQPRAW